MDTKTSLRSAFITSSGDPFVLLNCLHYFETVWQDEVDECWVALNSSMERGVMCELIKRFPKKVKFIYTNQRMGYGKPINMMLEMSPEGNVLLLEDDTIIFKKGIVDKYFSLLENQKYVFDKNSDIKVISNEHGMIIEKERNVSPYQLLGPQLIGSPRMSCTKEVADKLKKEFNLNYEGWGDKGCHFWPCFLWTRKSFLLQTDRNFDPSEWGDTFCWMSVQLRRLLKDKPNAILEIPQYHCSPDDFQNKERGLGIFDGECGYMHLGSLSSGIESYLIDEDGCPLADREAGIKAIDPKPVENTPEMQKRVMWWRHCSSKHGGQIPTFWIPYSLSLGEVIKKSEIDYDDLDKWEELYMGVIND